MFVEQQFKLQSKAYAYWHKGGWAKTERVVELPLAFEALAVAQSVLEVGNVTRQHDPSLEHLVIDLNEKHDDWENYQNADVLTYEPETDFDLVLSISTLEHTFDIVTAIRRVLSWAPNVIITIPLGYNSPGGTRTDDAVFEHKYDADVSFLCRTKDDPDEWFEISEDEARRVGFDGFRYGHSGIPVGATAIAVISKKAA